MTKQAIATSTASATKTPPADYFAAPTITVSSPTVYRTKPFSLTLRVGTGWLKAHRITPEDIWDSATSASTTLDGTLTSIHGCDVCGQKKLVTLGVSDGSNGFRREDVVSGTETYCWDSCRALCSSSRLHHHSRIVISLALASSSNTMASSITVATVPIEMLSKPKRKTSAESSSISSSQSITFDSTPIVTPHTPTGSSSTSATISTTTTAPHSSEPSPQAVTTTAAATTTADNITPTYVTVRVSNTTDPEHFSSNFANQLYQTLASLPDFVGYWYYRFDTTIVSVSKWQSPEAAMLGSRVIKSAVFLPLSFNNRAFLLFEAHSWN